MHRSIRRHLRFVFGAAAILLQPAAAPAATHGRYLLDPANSSVVFAYGHANPDQYDRSVRDAVKDLDVGEIRFDCDTYSGEPGGNGKGGLAIAGGFFMANGIGLKPGHTLAWVQIVNATTTGQNEWNLPQSNAGWFPDATPNAKAYPFSSTKVDLDPPATLGFQDFPERSFANPANEDWQAELGLVCIENEPDANGAKKVHVIATFYYGYTIVINHAAPFGVADVTAKPKFGWAPPSANFITTLTNFYDGQGGGGGPDNGGAAVASKKFTFVSESNCFQRSTCQPNRMLDEPFSYVPGNLVGQGGWAAHSGAGAKAVQVTGNAITIVQSAGSGEDVNRRFAAQPTNAKTYAGFDLKVAVGSLIGSTDYIAHFRPAPPDTNSFVARVHIGMPSTPTTYSIGIAAGSTGQGPTVMWPTPLDMGRSYSIVTAYDAVTGESFLWVNPADLSSPSVSTGATAVVAGKSVESYAFRQASPGGTTSTEVIDNLWVGTVLCVDTSMVPVATPVMLMFQGLLCVLGGAVLIRKRAMLHPS
jgi:hypothetical protein